MEDLADDTREGNEPLRLQDLLLHRPLLGLVEDDGGRADHPPARVAHDGAANLDRNPAAVAREAVGGEEKDLPLGRHTTPQLLFGDARALTGNQDSVRLTDNFLGRIAEQPFRARAPDMDPVPGIRHDERDRGLADHGLEGAGDQISRGGFSGAWRAIGRVRWRRIGPLGGIHGAQSSRRCERRSIAVDARGGSGD